MTPLVDGGWGATSVLVFAPVGRDAALTHEFLQRASIPNVICRSMTEVCDLIESGGAGARAEREDVQIGERQRLDERDRRGMVGDALARLRA